MEQEKTYSMEEAAEILGITRQRMYQLVRSGIIRPVHPKNRLEISQSEIDKEIEFRKKLQERRHGKRY